MASADAEQETRRVEISYGEWWPCLTIDDTYGDDDEENGTYRGVIALPVELIEAHNAAVDALDAADRAIEEYAKDLLVVQRYGQHG